MTKKTTTSEAGFALFDTALGPCGVAWSGRGLRAVEFESTAERLALRAGTTREAPPPAWVREAIDLIKAHLGGKPADLSAIAIDVADAPPVHRAAWELVRRVPPGRTTTYRDVALQLGDARKARAVGQAMAKNPLLLVVPCHRVLTGDGGAGGFSAPGGVATKAKILALEGVRLETKSQLALFAGKDKGGLPFDWEEAVKVLRRDPVMAGVIDRAPPTRLQLAHTQSPFAALAESIVYQQLNGRAAATIFGRVKALYPRKRFPTPDDILKTPDEALRGAGLSAAKLAAMRDLAAKAKEGVVPPLAALDDMADEEIIERLTVVRGIGRWTVEMLLIFRLGRADVLPVDDYGVRKGFARAHGQEELPKPRELAAHGERWKPFRSVAAWYLWRASEM